jgi:hypothetical protein
LELLAQVFTKQGARGLIIDFSKKKKMDGLLFSANKNKKWKSTI